MLTHAAWAGVPGLRHGFLGREEGDGTPGWAAVLARVGLPLPVLTPRQVHGIRVVTAASGPPPQADGLATADSGRLLGVVTADCVPVLLVDRKRRVAAAVHAGWRGVAAGVLEAALAHLESAFGARASDLEAALGPAIGGCCYEVGAEVREAFLARTGDPTATSWSTRRGRWFLDLRTASRCFLEAAGVPAVAVLGPCTACDPDYHSYRRDGAGAGRQLSFVGWT